MRPNRTLVFALIAVFILAFLAFQSGGVTDFLSYDCRRVGNAMRVNWMWDVSKGCFIQQPNGSWTPIDTSRIYQP